MTHQIYTVQKGTTQTWYGDTIGIIVLDACYPCIPGNVANSNSYTFPVRYQVIKNVSISNLLYSNEYNLSEPFIEAALILQEAGVKAISGACGFMALLQKQVAAALDIPVFLSSLLQIPFIYTITNKPIGVITADACVLTRKHFDGVGVSVDTPLFIRGMENCPEFSTSILKEKGTMDSRLVEEEAVTEALALQAEHPEIGSILLECSDLPPYASAIQKATGLPVFDYITMINYVAQSNRRVAYSGFM